MHMKMWHRFACIRTAINHGAKARFRNGKFFGQLTCDVEQMTQHSLVAINRFAQARDRFFGNDQQVNWRLRADVVDRDAAIILELDLGGDFAGDDFFEDGFGGAHRRIKLRRALARERAAASSRMKVSDSS